MKSHTSKDFAVLYTSHCPRGYRACALGFTCTVCGFIIYIYLSCHVLCDIVLVT